MTFVVADNASGNPRCGDQGRHARFSCLLSGDHVGDHRDSLGNTWEAAPLRYLGTEADSGKPALASTSPGGILDRVADVVDVESAATLLTVVSAILDVEDELSTAELSAFLRPTVDALRGVLGVAIKHLSDDEAREALQRGTAGVSTCAAER